MKLKAVTHNCTLKTSPEVSNTRALIDKVVGLMKPLGVKSEVVRVVDYHVAFDVTSKGGKTDGWPKILRKIKQADILIIDRAPSLS